MSATALSNRLLSDRRIHRTAYEFYVLLSRQPNISYDEAAAALKCSKKNVYRLEDTLIQNGYLHVQIHKSAAGRSVMRILLAPMELAS